MQAVVHSDRVVTPEGIGPGAVHFEHGRITRVEPGLVEPTGEYLALDATGLVVMPGGVDFHTHLEMTVNGVRTADDWDTGSRAALWGGTTTVVDFAEPGAGGSLMTGLQEGERLIGQRSMVDVGLHMTVTEASEARLSEMAEVVAAGQTSFKAYTAYPALMLDDPALTRVLERAAALGARVMVHCEEWGEIASRIDQAKAEGRTGALEHARTRPPETERRAVERVIGLAARAGAAVHLAHLSTAGSVEALYEARQRGLPVTAETCPHYLWLEEHRLGWPAPAGLCHVCAPPLRKAVHLQALWGALTAGLIDAVSTDHCPFDWAAGKARGLTPAGEDFTQTPGGLPGVETRLVLVFAGGVAAGRFDLARFVDLVSAGPARLAGLYPQKGALVPGADADLVLFDPDGVTALGVERLHSNVDHSPYEGLVVQGRVAGVIRQGELVVAEGRWLADPPPGRLLARRRLEAEDRLVVG